MIRFIFSHLWIVVFAILFGLGEFTFWYDAINRYKRHGDSENLWGLIVFHALMVGIASLAYFISTLPVAE